MKKNVSFDGNITECQQSALENNKDFFLGSDLSNDSYNCYIPLVDRKCNLSDLVSPMNTLIDELFGNTDNRNMASAVDISSISNLSLMPGIFRDNNTKCLQYTLPDKSD